MNSGWCVMKSVAGRNNSGWAPVRINFQEWRYNMGCMTCKNKNITQTMVDCSKYVCDVHFLLIWLLLIKDYTTNNLIKVWHWIDQIIFVYSLSKFLPTLSPTRSKSSQPKFFWNWKNGPKSMFSPQPRCKKKLAVGSRTTRPTALARYLFHRSPEF